MEKKEIRKWRDRLVKMFGVYHSDGQEYVTCPLCRINLDELANHMIKELDKAREEGYQKGWEDGSKGKVFEKIEVETEVTFKDLRDVIEGKEDAGEFLSKLTTK